MPEITFLSAEKRLSLFVPYGVSLLDAARESGILLESPCNGNGTCGKCKVKILQQSEDVQADQVSPVLTKEEQQHGIILACMTSADRDMTVEILSRQDSRNVQIIQHGIGLEVDLRTAISKRYHNTNDKTEVWAVAGLLGVEDGNTSTAHYGLVVDIGTTTLVAALFDFNDGHEVGSVARLNPQSHHAQDVLSRIKLASTESGLSVLHTEFITVLNAMIDDLTKETSVKSKHIYEIIFSGNTCMLHLALAVDPSSLGKYPYTPAIKGGMIYQASVYGIHVADFAQIYLPPVMSAYVGADITSGILAAKLKEQKGLTLFVDVGTNGEMVLAADGNLLATSTAAGPAFEGMNIEFGMRAAPGAIEKFSISDNNLIEIKTIGDKEPIGICGSGLLDIVGELVKYGFIQGTGKLKDSAVKPELADRLVKKAGKTVFQIAGEVYLSQKDIRQVQLAKGAIRAGIEALLAKNGVLPEQVDRVYIAGSFGYHLNPASLVHIGMLPAAFQDKIEFLGNTSKTGGQAFLLNHTVRQTMSDVVKQVEVLELATSANFDKLFVSCLNF
ncbi:(Fe-S)-binding protein [Sporomusaceae bacterium FL31]|nr:(Fe-S)-binding protein [Sporomusaceae bacterium FL31]GCE32337.1 (Fe-S)-binding protein [Sporomusaceae bacterium]